MGIHWRRAAAPGLLAIVLVALGCGPSTATVTGTVTFRGRPLPAGTVVFHGPDGRTGHALIADGRYTVEAAPLGPVRISVRAHAGRPAGMPGLNGKVPPAPKEAAAGIEGPPDGKHVPIPPRYQDPETSDLTYTVRAGDQTHDVDLRP